MLLFRALGEQYKIKRNGITGFLRLQINHGFISIPIVKVGKVIEMMNTMLFGLINETKNKIFARDMPSISFTI